MLPLPSRCALLLAAFVSAPALADPSVLIRPTSATTGSQFSGSYDIGNAIDGSGLPAGFTLADSHANYAVNNHWTTQNGAIAAGTAWAEFAFASAQTLGQFHLWNHRSNVIASNAHYAVTQFDLELRGAGGVVLLRLDDVQAAGQLAGSYGGGVQTFTFAGTAGVTSVWFHIDSNLRTDLGLGGANCTGEAEVAFGAPVPEPGTWALMLAGGALLAGVARRRTR